MLNGLSGRAFDNIAKLVRDAAAREAQRPSLENLPLSVADARARRETVDPETNERRVEYHARRSFIHDLSMEPKRVAMLVTNRGNAVFSPRSA